MLKNQSTEDRSLKNIKKEKVFHIRIFLIYILQFVQIFFLHAYYEIILFGNSTNFSLLHSSHVCWFHLLIHSISCSHVYRSCIQTCSNCLFITKYSSTRKREKKKKKKRKRKRKMAAVSAVTYCLKSADVS